MTASFRATAILAFLKRIRLASLGATHFLMKRLKNVRTEMALSVLAYNLTRVMSILGIRPLIQAMGA
jgi:transposase